ncbi:MAG: UdgX family uracil-DNA binding protein [Egibacteraceae bacterium]
MQPATADLMLVGEQPGDREDLQGRPFVGPAGQVLAHALSEAGIDQGRAYVTNVVKHFKFTARGKRRIHRTPSALQVRACRHWLDSEFAIVDPKVIVCLGATAAKALMGSGFRVTRQRGEVFGWPDSDPQRRIMATIHPSAWTTSIGRAEWPTSSLICGSLLACSGRGSRTGVSRHRRGLFTAYPADS